jgi:hypothetical protein
VGEIAAELTVDRILSPLNDVERLGSGLAPVFRGAGDRRLAGAEFWASSLADTSGFGNPDTYNAKQRPLAT